MNSKKSTHNLQHGNEPTSLLLSLVWSAVETLLERGEARIFVGNGEVAIVFANTSKTDEGLVPTVPESVGNEK